ncbi:TonB-dependent receptor [Sphingomonas sp.]|uniref:TonB-dependent receptor n=1 Tax=Sphingomonas sp. TaxID=28214 RepID=UPI0025E180E1|nr:TonB-dependent receptor [Sphingomonas sp.]
MGQLLRSGVSVVALCVMAAAAPALAQDNPAPAAQDDQQDDQGSTEPGIVVTGIRASLANSQNIKRNSDTVVDAITASDIGALPDRSVTEALQRVPGVSMNRFAGSNDPDHFSVEGSGVVVRGLSFVRSEFNGRDTFSTGVYGQSINFSDVPAELLGSVEVYKNLTAEMTEGGLSGTVNLNSRVPFQNKGFHLSVDLEGNYGDMKKKWSPTGSILISDTWDTGIGRIGVLANLSYSQILSRSDGIQVTNFQQRDNMLALGANTTTVQVCRNPLPGDTDTTTLPAGGSACGAAGTAGSDTLADYASGPRWAPLGGQYRTQDYDRERTGLALAAQWESLDRRALVTAQFLRTDSTQKWGEHTFESAPDLSDYNTYPYGCQPNGNGPGALPAGSNPTSTTRAECPVGTFKNYSYDADGVFEKGYITFPGTGWRAGNNDSGGSWRTPTGGMQQSLSRRQVDDENIVDDYGLNFKFTPDDHWQINLDSQYVRAQHDTLDVSVFGSTFADQELDLTGDLPVLVNHKPLFLGGGWSSTGQPTPYLDAHIAQSDAQYFQSVGNYYWRAAMDHVEHSIGEEVALKGDVAYNFNNDGFLKRIKFGARYADRDQHIRYTSYNWGVLSETWAGTGQVWMDNPVSAGKQSFYDFPDFFRGQIPGPVGGWFYNADLIQGYPGAASFFKQIEATGGATGAFNPAAGRPGVVPGTAFLPSEIQNVSERTINGYVMVSFGDDDLFGDVGLTGNIGVRYVDTKVSSEGAFTIPTQAQLGVTQPYLTTGGVQGRCDPPAAPPPGAPPAQPPGGVCNLGAAGYAQLQTFANGANFPNTALNGYRYFLPSLNLKLGITDNLIARFAASRAMARPGMADIRNYITIGSNPDDAARLLATAGNPFLKPAMSDQFDVTLEWYFAKVGSLTIDGFYKNIHNFFYQAVTERSITNNGVTKTVDIRGPANFDGSGKVKGFEVAYQQTFDFLPSLLSGLGVNASYTFIDSEGLPMNRPADGPGTNFKFARLPLEQMSKHNVNLAVFYEKGPISLRAAYNWRSRFLLTSADVIYPFTPIFNDKTGTLDGSAFFNIAKNIKIGVQGVNLLNEVTKTLQMFTPDGKLGPRSYFMNDRRYSFIVRANF